MIGKVTVKEEKVPGHALKPGVYPVREDMCFEVKGGVPSELRKKARDLFQKKYGDSLQLLSCTTHKRTNITILFRRGKPAPVVEPGWSHRGPASKRRR